MQTRSVTDDQLDAMLAVFLPAGLEVKILTPSGAWVRRPLKAAVQFRPSETTPARMDGRPCLQIERSGRLIRFDGNDAVLACEVGRTQTTI